MGAELEAQGVGERQGVRSCYLEAEHLLSSQLYEMGTTILPTVQREKLRP